MSLRRQPGKSGEDEQVNAVRNIVDMVDTLRNQSRKISFLATVESHINHPCNSEGCFIVGANF